MPTTMTGPDHGAGHDRSAATEAFIERMVEIGPLVETVYDAIRDWFPRARVAHCEELAHHIVCDVLQIFPEGDFYVAQISRAWVRGQGNRI